jgi:patatin-like phospholipase/acyl hydrolase
MTEKNEKSANFHEFLTLRRDRKCRTIRVNQRSFKRNRLDLNRLNHFREALQDQDKQSQNCDDHEKSIKMQRQKSSEERNQREERVKNFKEFVQFVRIKNVKRFVDQTLNHHFRQQLKRHELRSTIQDDDAKHSRNDYLRVDQ